VAQHRCVRAELKTGGRAPPGSNGWARFNGGACVSVCGHASTPNQSRTRPGRATTAVSQCAWWRAWRPCRTGRARVWRVSSFFFRFCRSAADAVCERAADTVLLLCFLLLQQKKGGEERGETRQLASPQLKSGDTPSTTRAMPLSRAAAAAGASTSGRTWSAAPAPPANAGGRPRRRGPPCPPRGAASSPPPPPSGGGAGRRLGRRQVSQCGGGARVSARVRGPTNTSCTGWRGLGGGGRLSMAAAAPSHVPAHHQHKQTHSSTAATARACHLSRPRPLPAACWKKWTTR
jgi:hypothetical protein